MFASIQLGLVFIFPEIKSHFDWAINNKCLAIVETHAMVGNTCVMRGLHIRLSALQYLRG